MLRNILILTLTTMIFTSCNSYQTTQRRENNITKVCFAAGGGLELSPYIAIEIDSSLTYKFYGGEYSDIKGYFTGNVSQGFWDTLNIKFELVNYKQLDTSYEHTIDDPSTETILYFNNQRKHIRAQRGSLPDSLLNVFSWLMNSHKIVALTKTTDNAITFETKRQIPVPPPIMVDTIKFTPPKTDNSKH